MLVGAVGLALALIGLAALWLPIELDAHDAYGFPIQCGNGFSSNLSAGQGAGAGAADQCESALLTRRAWAIPSAAIGWLLITVFLIAWARATPPARSDLLSQNWTV
jgi:hypothetical protein